MKKEILKTSTGEIYTLFKKKRNPLLSYGLFQTYMDISITL